MKNMSLDQKIDQLSQEMKQGFVAMKAGFEDAKKDRALIRVEAKDQVEELARMTKDGFDEQGTRIDRVINVELFQIKQRVTLLEQAFALEK
jgi:hypothetical protein